MMRDLLNLLGQSLFVFIPHILSVGHPLTLYLHNAEKSNT